MFKKKKANAEKPQQTESAVSGSKLLDVYEPAAAKPVAKVVLNGYNIEKDATFGKHGSMCSFRVVDGDLWDTWNAQLLLTLRAPNGKEAVVKVAAMPVDEESYGLLEFL
jgi:hypothetical protein